MKTLKEITEEIIELHASSKSLGELMDHIHTIRIEKTKQMFALNHMRNEMINDLGDAK